ncbi:helix-turn-helix transcriptional regulator [Streptomyces lonarensis]|uniref:HTH luxR-type domain-containing protein n=1 Tax=Streptomyces lonarensis TaxID=700599 RepID=A0A7X6CXR4_9ACTN|nr:helix-turn-helix transcriptional regulator [Streptomyces lonarensis]NJQ04488.1 hypothetical protein [Streptomyces lonarensis]
MGEAVPVDRPRQAVRAVRARGADPADPRPEAVLDTLAAAQRNGGSVLLEIAGDPGLGKTRLLDGLAARAGHRGLRAVRRPAGAVPGVLNCLDDLHRLAGASWDPVHRLLDRSPTVPTVVACAVRPRQLTARHTLALTAADPAWHTERITLGPLSPAEFDPLLPAATSDPRRERLYRLTGGVPGWLPLLTGLPDAELRELTQTGRFRGPLPADPGTALRRELAQLSAAQLAVARAAAVVGDTFDPAVTAAVCGRDTEAVLGELDALAALDIVRAEADGPCFRFRHTLLGAVIHARTPPGWRLAAHARAADALLGAGATPTDRAPHLARSATPGDHAAVAVLRAAADHDLPVAPTRAARWLDAAHRIAPGSGDAAARRAVLLDRYRAAERVGRLRVCRELLPELRVLLVEADPASWAEVVTLHAALEQGAGHGPEARALLEAEQPVLPAGALDAPLAALAAERGDCAAVTALLPNGPHTEPPGPCLDTAASEALAAALAGEPAPDAAHRAGQLLERLGDAALAARLDTAERLARAWLHEQRWADAERLLGRAVRAAERCGRSGRLPMLLTARGRVLLGLGRPADAVAAARTAGLAAFDVDRPDLAVSAHDLELLAARWTRGPGAGQATHDHRCGPETAALIRLAEALAAPGGPEEHTPGPHESDRYAAGGAVLLECAARLLRARAHLAADRPADAERETHRAKSLAERTGSPWLTRLAADRQRALGARRRRRGPELSGREQEITDLVRQGLPNREIAAALFVSVKTVETHLTRIFRKAGVRSRAELTAVLAAVR